MATDGSKWSQVSAAPPRKINVQKFAESRASELESLHSIVANRLNNDFRSLRNKRRRTTAHDDQIAKKRYRKRQKLGVVDKSDALALEKDQEKVPRHFRRRVKLRRNPDNGFCTSGDGTKRLRTHVWHAKRFTMTKLWGFHLPLGLQGRGRGSRALLKWFKHKVLVHDASYYVAVQLEGPEDSLMSILQMVMVPSPSAQSEDVSHSVLSGVIHGSAMLHHVGAPHSQSIAPVSYMWQPSNLQNREDDSNGGNAIRCNEPHRIESSCFRQLWVWIHASAFSEGYDALKVACQKKMNEMGIFIKCISLEGQLAMLEVIGSKAFQLLQKTLHPVTCISENSWQLNKCLVANADDDSRITKFSVLENKEHSSSRAILSLTVKDPRVLPDKRIADVSESASISIVDNIPEVETEGNSTFSENKSLWDASSGLSPPVEENVLCMEKHHMRMNFLCLDNKTSGELKTSNRVQCSRSCPIMLLKNNHQNGSPVGWSVLLPSSWVRVFWNSFVSKGAHAIGFREKNWIACEIGLPYFPSDFPDCNAYSSLMATEAAASVRESERRPPAIRPLKIPIPPPWDSVCIALDKGPTRVQDTQNSNEKDMVDGYLLSTTCGKSHVTSFGCHGSSLFVARTSSVLTSFLNDINGDHLLLFPQVSNRKASILKFMRDESKLGQGHNGITKINYDNKLCFLRTLLRPYKEGVFEDGAVVCAPFVTDITLWNSRSGNNEGGLKIPESSVGSYFKEQSSGKWELQIPDDPTIRKSYRLPIGFVTTGFVRGSKKPVANAFCEAVLLAQLREEQWNEMPQKRRKEIYVLVRNLRSSAYRLALATIVLEHQEEDVEFM